MSTLPGKRVKIRKWVHGRQCVVQVEVEAVLPDADPTQPYLEPETLRRLDEIQSLADAGAIDALQACGTVYVRKSA